MIGNGYLFLCDVYFNLGCVFYEGGIELLIRGMMVQKVQEVDLKFFDLVCNFLFGINMMGFDFVVLNI